MKIVILDGYTLNPGDLSWDSLKEFGDVTIYDRTPKEKIVERISDAEIVYTNKTPLTKDIFERCPSIKWVGVLATGYNVVDIETAKDRGIPVCNVPTYGTNAVAQMVFALLLELCHHVGDHSKSVFDGQWSRSKDFCYWNHPLTELTDKTMGIIGLGKIGQATARIAHAFGMKVLAYDTNRVNGLESDTPKYVGLVELLSNSDVISLHCPLFDSTRGIINKTTIEQMKDGVMVINTSRGALIVEEDLKAALDSGKVGGAACDVVSAEPIECDNVLLTAQNMIITPHIAWAPLESRQRLMEVAVNNLREFLMGNITNAVNMQFNTFI